MDNEQIKDNFSKGAQTYDSHSDVQLVTAQKLIDFGPQIKPKKILEIGCGSGNYTLLLAKKYSDAKITAVDISPDMIEIATEKLKGQYAEFIVSDAEKIKLKERYDLITSNATLHWFSEPAKALQSYKTALDEKGIITFSYFGPLTFRELSDSIKTTMGEDRLISAEKFLDKISLARMLDGIFSRVIIAESDIVAESSNLLDLLTKIKYTGTRGVGLNNPYLFGKDKLAKVESAYLEKYGKIISTYQIFFCMVMP